MLKKYAQEIADSTAEVIDYAVFVTDMDGIIIGCSDPNRGLGTLHEASLRAIKTKRGYLEDEEEAKRFRGTNPGATYPVEEPSGKIVGTIAITGDPKKVAPFALVIKKQAEILLREKLLQEVVLNQERTLQNLIQNIASYDSHTDDDAAIAERARYFGYDSRLAYIAIAVELLKYKPTNGEQRYAEEYSNTEILVQSMRTRVLWHIRNIFNKPQDIATAVGDNKYVIMRSIYPNILRDEEGLWDKVNIECSKLKEVLISNGLYANIGVGSISRSIKELSISYNESWEAISIGKKLHPYQGIYKIFDFRVEKIFLTANRKYLIEHIKMHIGELKEQPDWIEIRDTVIAWCESQFNLSQAAQRLHIHRNTMDYRLNKIEGICGINTREFRQVLKIYIAIQMDLCCGESPY